MSLFDLHGLPTINNTLLAIRSQLRYPNAMAKYLLLSTGWTVRTAVLIVRLAHYKYQGDLDACGDVDS